MSTRVFNPRNPSPFGASMNTIERRDEEMRATDGYTPDTPEGEDAPSSIVRNSPLYQAQVNLVKHLQRQLAEANERIAQLESGVVKKKKRRRTAERHQSPDEIVVDRVTYVSANWIARQTGLHQSNVSRKLAALGATPDKVEGNKYYYRKSKLPEIKNKRRNR